MFKFKFFTFVKDTQSVPSKTCTVLNLFYMLIAPPIIYTHFIKATKHILWKQFIDIYRKKLSNEWINSCADKAYSTAFVRFAKCTVIAIKFNLTKTKFWLIQTKNQRKFYYKTQVFELKPIDNYTQITIKNYSSALEKIPRVSEIIPHQ